MKVAPFLLGALGVLLLLLYWSPGAGVVAGIVVLLLLPGRWWRWRTRRFRRGLRALNKQFNIPMSLFGSPYNQTWYSSLHH